MDQAARSFTKKATRGVRRHPDMTDGTERRVRCAESKAGAARVMVLTQCRIQTVQTLDSSTVSLAMPLAG